MSRKTASINSDPSNRCLYVFLDEGGNFDFSGNGTKYFTLTAVTAARPFCWYGPLASLKYDLIEEGSEIDCFHASEDEQEVRNRVFRCIADNLVSLRIDSLIVEKRKTGPALQPVAKFYPRMMGYLLQYVLRPQNLQYVTEVIIITDSLPLKKKRGAIKKGIKLDLASRLCPETKYRLLHHASKSCLGLQVVDYCNWAIYRKWSRQDLRSYELIQTGIKSEFDVFRWGTT